VLKYLEIVKERFLTHPSQFIRVHNLLIWCYMTNVVNPFHATIEISRLETLALFALMPYSIINFLLFDLCVNY